MKIKVKNKEGKWEDLEVHFGSFMLWVLLVKIAIAGIAVGIIIVFGLMDIIIRSALLTGVPLLA